jgi:hypothetical protein
MNNKDLETVLMAEMVHDMQAALAKAIYAFALREKSNPNFNAALGAALQMLVGAIDKDVPGFSKVMRLLLEKAENSR